jgi:large subunit ribosomal protein L15
MKINELKLPRDKKIVRVGRGISAGGGKTAGRGTKGQNSRTGGKVRPGFEGGQIPLAMRLPKLRGFKSKRPKKVGIYTSQIGLLKSKKIDNQVLFEAGLVSNAFSAVKLLFDEPLKSAFEVKLQGASANASSAIQKAGGSFVKIARPKQASQKVKA